MEAIERVDLDPTHFGIIWTRCDLKNKFTVLKGQRVLAQIIEKSKIRPSKLNKIEA